MGENWNYDFPLMPQNPAEPITPSKEEDASNHSPSSQLSTGFLPRDGTFHELEHMPSLPELDDRASTGSLSSKAPSTGNTSLINPTMQRLPEFEHDKVEVGDGGVSMYAPSRFPNGTIHRQVFRRSDESTTFNSNRSIAQVGSDFVVENGRRYTGSYFMPNDKKEQTRLMLIHTVYKNAYPDEPSTVKLEDPTAILDVGTATGEWAIDMADLYPDCEVTGIDIADVFPRFVSPNLFWEIDDASLEWLRPSDTYDLVHFRDMSGSFSDWPFVYREAFRCIKPGGWIELWDKNDMGSKGNFMSFFRPDSPLHRCSRDWFAAAAEAGKPLGIKHLDLQLLRDVGFVDVGLVERNIHISPRKMETGHIFVKAMLESAEAYGMRLLTKYKGYTAEKVREDCNQIRADLKAIALDRDKTEDFVMQFVVLTGRKPRDDEVGSLEHTVDAQQ